MRKQILLISGHPDADPKRYLHALMQAYAEGARGAGHSVRIIEVARIVFRPLSTAEDFAHGKAPPDIVAAQRLVRWADHVVFLFPLWLGGMPALMKAFMEQLLRPGFAFEPGKRLPKRLLAGRTARIVVTMGMPALFFRCVYQANGLKAVERNMLAFCGFRPVRSTVIGSVEALSAKARAAWLENMVVLGRAAK